MKDFLGNEYGPGDFVVYGQASGRCINMSYGQVIEITEKGKVKIQPLAGSRWNGNSGQSYYIDERTGNRIIPWLDKHIKSFGYQRCVTHDKILVNYMDEGRKAHYPWKSGCEHEWVKTVFNDYVKQVNEGPKPVTISVTENIVKVNEQKLGE